MFERLTDPTVSLLKGIGSLKLMMNLNNQHNHNETLDISLVHAQVIILEFVKVGFEFEQACEFLGFPKFTYGALSYREKVSIDDFLQACEKAVNYFKEPSLFFRIANNVSFLDLGTIALALKEEGTLRKALNLYNTLFSSISNIGSASWLHEGDFSKHICVYDDRYAEQLYAFSELRCGALIRFVQLVNKLQSHKLVSQVYFQHKPKDSVEVYSKICGAPVIFNSPYTGFAINNEFLDFEYTAGDPLLKAVFKEKIERELKAIAKGKITLELESYLSTNLSEDLSLSKVANHFRMSESTLKRKLLQEKTQYKKVLAEVRNREAKTLLYNAELSIEEIASLTGYSSTSSFSQSFKRVNGIAPLKFQKQILL